MAELRWNRCACTSVYERLGKLSEAGFAGFSDFRIFRMAEAMLALVRLCERLREITSVLREIGCVVRSRICGISWNFGMEKSLLAQARLYERL